MSEIQLIWGARAMMAMSLTAGVLLALFSPGLVANLLAMSYFGTTQCVVPIVLGFLWKRATKQGICAGLVVGVAVIFLITTVPYGINKGAVALLINLAVTVIVSLLTKQDGKVAKRFEDYHTVNLKKFASENSKPAATKASV